MVSLDVQKSYRYHTYLLLSKKPAIFCFFYQKSMKLFEMGRFSHFRSTNIIEVISHLIWIPLHFFRGFVASDRILFDKVNFLLQILHGFLPMLVYRIDPEADIQWLFELIIENVPLFFTEQLEPLIVLNKLIVVLF